MRVLPAARGAGQHTLPVRPHHRAIPRRADRRREFAYACFHCNSFKGPNVAGVDPVTNDIVRLFHPRRDAREEHLQWQNELIIGLTPVGRATLRVLRLNHPLRLVIRRSLLAEGIRFA